jgi:hypothetical protein
MLLHSTNGLNELIQQVTLLICIWKLPDSNLGYDTDSSQSFQANARIVPQAMARLLPSKSFPIYHSLIILPFGTIQYSL